jgi:hypothetical protein
MQRIVSQSTAELIAEGLALLPGRLPERLAHVEFAECRPQFVGLHDYPDTQDVPHTMGDEHDEWFGRPRSQWATTIVLPPECLDWLGPHTIVHELGHALDRLDGRTWIASPVSSYAETNRAEAFAEAFVAWVLADQGGAYLRRLTWPKVPTRSVFEQWAYA